MAEATILERQKQAVVSGDKLNSKATREIEELLEASEREHTKRRTDNGGWYFRVPQAGVTYYSF